MTVINKHTKIKSSAVSYQNYPNRIEYTRIFYPVTSQRSSYDPIITKSFQSLVEF